MILPFLYHHLDRAKRGEIRRSIVNCHVRGLTSIMLHEAEGNTVRLYYANQDHAMYWSGYDKDPMPLAIHGHRTDLTLIGVFGNAASIVFEDSKEGALLHACEFRSHILNGAGSLERLGHARRLAEVWERSRRLCWGADQFLKSRELHTVIVPRGCAAAWLVVEGRVDDEPSQICYTNNPRWSPEGLYQEASQAEIVAALADVVRMTPGIDRLTDDSGRQS